MDEKFKPYQQVLVRNHKEDVWVCAFFSHYNENSEIYGKYICAGGEGWNCCIPYEGNERLVGTSESPEEKEKFEFGDKVMVSDFKDIPHRKGIFVEYNDKNSKYVVLTKSSRTIDEWRHCKKGWDEDE